MTPPSDDSTPSDPPSLESWGWDAEWAAHLDASGIAGEPARVSSRSRTLWTLQAAGGSRLARRLASGVETDPPAVGDWVVADEEAGAPSDPWRIEAILPRRSKLSRKAAGDKEVEQVVAANVDRVWILHGLDQPMHARTLERYLAAAWASGAQPEVVLTKSDMSIDADGAVRTVRETAPGVESRVVSVRAAPFCDDLAATLSPGETIALMGPSGVGKSSLVNYLAGEAVAAEGEVRESDGKGRHTTTRRQLIRLPVGALVVDTPGMRELEPWQASDGIESTFPEIDELSPQCRFRNCRHESEPGCAVREALESGEVLPERLESFRRLESQARRQEAGTGRGHRGRGGR